MVRTVEFEPPAWNTAEILRYAGCRAPGAAERELMEECVARAQRALVYRVCWDELPVACDGSAPGLESRALARQLRGCTRCVAYAATLGLELDRLIARCCALSPARALMLQAIGAHRIRALSDAFCARAAAEAAGWGLCVGPRLSPGNGDTPLEAQRELFRALDCPRNIGLFLGDSLLMSPSKSVTAILGLAPGPGGARRGAGCADCALENCAFRE